VNQPVTFEDYERSKRHPNEFDVATQAHIAVSKAISAFGDDPTTDNRGYLLCAIHAYTDRVCEDRSGSADATVNELMRDGARLMPLDSAQRAAWVGCVYAVLNESTAVPRTDGQYAPTDAIAHLQERLATGDDGNSGLVVVRRDALRAALQVGPTPEPTETVSKDELLRLLKMCAECPRS
jgi:hypothetical protein